MGWTWEVRVVCQVEKLGGKALLFWNNDKFIFAILNFIENGEKMKP